MNEESQVKSDALYELDVIELRVLGCLMEKELTTPDQYPLTENSVRLAANQKSNREPMMNLQQGEVLRALRQLDEKAYVETRSGSRSERFAQCARHTLDFSSAEQAILCMIFLRGPQTVAELKARTERMVSGEEELNDALDHLQTRNPPYIELMEKQPGQREARYRQLIFPQEIEVSKASAVSKPVEVCNLDEERFAELEAQIKQLTERVAALEQKSHEG